MSAEPRARVTQTSEGSLEARGLSVCHAFLLWTVFAAISLVVLRPALHGAFINDDHALIANHLYLTPLSVENLAAIFDPFGAAAINGVNYAPLMLLLHALEKAIYGSDTFGYHVTNAAVHALDCVLLIALLISTRVPRSAAMLSGLLFAVHPANVEAVAWISQLKTLVSFAFAFGAVLAQSRHPAFALMLFAMGLLTKASAITALPMAAALCWSRRAPARQWVWLAGWVIAAGLYAIPELGVQVGIEASPYPNAWVQIQSIFSYWARYLVMAATSYGVSPFQEPAPVDSILDPWWIGGLLTALLLAWRTIAALRAQSPEAAYWIAAAASFGPVSQISPFMYAMADRYLYFVLPGLIGGGLLAAREIRARCCAALSDPAKRSRWASASNLLCALGAALAALAFAVRSHELAELWRNELRLLERATARFPEGSNAAYFRALLAAEQRDVEGAVRELRTAASINLGNAVKFSADPRFEPISREPLFHELVDEFAGRWIEFAEKRDLESQTWLRSTGQAHRVRGEYRDAVECFERALRLGGPLDAEILRDLERTRTEWRKIKKASEP